MAIGTAAAIALGVGALGSSAIGAMSAKQAGKYQTQAANAGVAETRAAREERQCFSKHLQLVVFVAAICKAHCLSFARSF